MRRGVKYNDVDNYSYLTILGITGAYIEEHIHVKTLPDGFFHYELERAKDRTEKFSAIGKKVRFGYCGDFITKEQLHIPDKGTTKLDRASWSFSEDEFQFERFFGMKLSIHKQIRDAELKRDSLREKQVSGNQIEENSDEF